MAVLFQPLFVAEHAAPLAPLFSTSLTSDGSAPNTNLVQIFPTAFGANTRFRVRFVNGTDPSSTFTAAYIGELSGTYSFAAAPTQITWNGGASTSLVFSNAGIYATSDTITHTPVSTTGKICIAFHVASDNNAIRYKINTGSGFAAYYKAGANDSSTQAKTGYTVWGVQRLNCIELIEGAA